MAARPIGSAELKELVARDAQMELRIPVTALARLAALAPPPGDDGAAELLARLRFRRAAGGQAVLELAVAGPVPLVCQRCLGPIAWPVQLEANLTVVSSDEEALALAEPFEAVVTTDEGLDPVLVVEDEVLAALPLAPVHSAGTDCGALGDRVPSSEPGRHRPLAGLGRLLARPPRPTGD